MSLKFLIKPVLGKSEKEGDMIVRYTGMTEPFVKRSERQVNAVGVDGAGNPTLIFNTGLDEDKVDFYNWYNEEEKKEVLEQIKQYKPIILKAYGGAKNIDDTNKFFWAKDDQYILKVSNDSDKIFFDTKNPSHALLYLSIIGGAFIETVAPTKEYAERYRISHYLALENEAFDYDDDEEFTRTEAYAALSKLKDESPEGLLFLGWCLQYDTSSFGGYTKATPAKTLLKYHAQFIDGKLQTKKKRNCPAQFLDYAKKWEGQQTREKVMTEGYVKAGEYYALINQREKKYELFNGTALGNNITDVVANLHKPKFTQDYEVLREAVEKKWAE